MRRSLLLHVMLAFVWMAVTGSFTGTSLLVGFLIGYLIIRILQPLIETKPYVQKVWLLFEFVLFILREVAVASTRVAADALTPRERSRPGVIAVPLDVRTDGEITVLANVLSLTPGTLSLDVSDDKRTLYVHSMYIPDRDVEKERQRIKDQIERRVLAAFRSASE